MNDIQLHRLDLNLLVTFEALMRTRSVSGAAQLLGKTPSAVSHALSRLREQLGDPLLVKVGGKMQPSPFALRLIEDVRPVLRTIQRVVRPPEPFDPATSHRVFRLSVMPLVPLMADVVERVHAVAPNVGLEWLPVGPDTYRQAADEQVDIAIHVAAGPLPEGLSERVLAPLPRYVFARDGHPALENWTREAWMFWPHLMVGMSDSARQTVEERVAQIGIERRIGARIPEFSGVGPLIAHSNMLANQLAIAVLGEIDQYGLRVLECPVDLPDLTFRFFWNTRLSNDPGNSWIRTIVMQCWDDLVARAACRIAQADVIRPRAQ